MLRGTGRDRGAPPILRVTPSKVRTGWGRRDCCHFVLALGEVEVDNPFHELVCRMSVPVSCAGITTNVSGISSFWALVSGMLSGAPGPLGGAG